MPAQYGPHRWTGDDSQAGALRGARFAVADVAGTTFLDCDLSGVRIVDSWLVDVQLSGYVQHLLVNGVDVTGFVEAELDRRHPERVQLRAVANADDFRAMWATLEGLWAEAVARVERLPAAAAHERVDGEWSFVQTLRHLVFIADSWASRTVLDEPLPYHPLGLTQTAYPPADAAALGLDLHAQPSFDAVQAARGQRLATVRGIIDGLTDTELGRQCTRTPAPGYPEETRFVGECLGVVLNEEAEHYRFAVRDLAVLEAR